MEGWAVEDRTCGLNPGDPGGPSPRGGCWETGEQCRALSPALPPHLTLALALNPALSQAIG